MDGSLNDLHEGLLTVRRVPRIDADVTTRLPNGSSLPLRLATSLRDSELVFSVT